MEFIDLGDIVCFLLFCEKHLKILKETRKILLLFTRLLKRFSK